MSVRIGIATTAADRHAVFRFRYSIYVEEMGRSQKYADHDRKTIEEPLDKTGHILAAREGDEIVGTARFNVGADEHFGYYETLYSLRAFGPFYPDAVSMTTKLMVAPQYRRSTLPLKLAIACYTGGTPLGTCFDFIDCNPPLVGFFERLGYRQVFPNVEHPEFGSVVPMVCVLYDVVYLKSVDSPFAKHAASLNDKRKSVDFFHCNINKQRTTRWL